MNQRLELLVVPGLREGALKRFIMRWSCRFEQGHAFGCHIGIDAAPISWAEKTRKQTSLLEPRDQTRCRTLAEDDRFGDLLHVEMTAGAIVLATEHGEQGIFPDAEPVASLERLLDVCLDALVQRGQDAPALRKSSVLRPGCGHVRSFLFSFYA
jgi:hypothetical protein